MSYQHRRLCERFTYSLDEAGEAFVLSFPFSALTVASVSSIFGSSIRSRLIEPESDCRTPLRALVLLTI